jgi:hypothetical protein
VRRHTFLAIVAVGIACGQSDPCKTNNGGCDPNASCTDNSGTAACACNTGYTGDGTTCTLDPCLTNNGDCDPNATCASPTGTPVCSCNAGYTADGTTCIVDFSGAWAGSITETYTCAASNPPMFVIPTDTYTISQSGADVTIGIGSCPGDTFTGTVSGDTVTIAASTAFTCDQTDSSNSEAITVDTIGGTLTVSGTPPTLQVNLTESATVSGDTCAGVATGQLSGGN